MKHEQHYGGQDSLYEAIKVIEAWELGFNLGNVVKYLSRAGKKDGNSRERDLEKALWYLDREIRNVQLTEPSGELTLHGIERLGWKESKSYTTPSGLYCIAYVKEGYILCVFVGKDPFKTEEATLQDLKKGNVVGVKTFEELNEIVK